jgi:uncharacterized membrane protein YkvA (DUF1232 family)
MLKALDEQLRMLANSATDNFKEVIAIRFKGKVTDDQVKTLKEFIFLMPPVLKQLRGYWNNSASPHEAKRLADLILTYVFNPNDYLSYETYGLFGYLDDAYLVVSSLLKIEDAFPRNWNQRKPEEIELVHRARKLIEAPRFVIPDVTAKIDKMVSAVLKGEANGFGDSVF